jgi:hypothetical protein
VNTSADCKSVWHPIYASIVVQHLSKVNKWPEDSFLKDETCCLFEYVNKQIVLNWSLCVQFLCNLCFWHNGMDNIKNNIKLARRYGSRQIYLLNIQCCYTVLRLTMLFLSLGFSQCLISLKYKNEIGLGHFRIWDTKLIEIKIFRFRKIGHV